MKKCKIKKISDRMICDCCHEKKQILQELEDLKKKRSLEKFKKNRWNKSNSPGKRPQPKSDPYLMIGCPNIPVSDEERFLRKENLVEFEMNVSVIGFDRDVTYNQVFLRSTSEKKFLYDIFDELSWGDDMHMSDKMHYIILKRLKTIYTTQLHWRSDDDLLPFLNDSKGDYFFNPNEKTDQETIRTTKILEDYLQMKYPHINISDEDYILMGIDHDDDDEYEYEYDDDYLSVSSDTG